VIRLKPDMATRISISPSFHLDSEVPGSRRTQRYKTSIDYFQKYREPTAATTSVVDQYVDRCEQGASSASRAARKREAKDAIKKQQREVEDKKARPKKRGAKQKAADEASAKQKAAE